MLHLHRVGTILGAHATEHISAMRILPIAVVVDLSIAISSLLAQPSSVLVLRGVSIVGLSGSADQSGRDIIIEGNKIRAVVAGGRAQMAEAQVIELAGRWVMPGFIDMHVQLAAKDIDWAREEDEFHDLLASGVTTVFDHGGREEVLQELAMRSRDASWVGPRVLHCGSALWGEPPAGGDSASQRQVVRNATETDAAVARIKKSGAVAVKIERNLPAKTAKAAIAAARSQGLLVVAAPGAMSFTEAAENGVDMLQSLSSFATDFVGGGQRQKLAKVWSPDFIDAWEKVNPLRNVRQKVDKLASLGTYFVPDLAGEMNYLDEYAPSARAPQVAALRKKYADVMRLAYAAGVPLIAGSTYSTAGNERITIVDELRAWVRAGLDSRLGLEAATINAAHALRMAESLGQIAPGCVADLVVLAGNPAADISYLQNPVMVLRDGKAYPAGQLLTVELRRRRDERAIRALLERQEIAWNEHDLRRFMQGYWQSDNLVFASGGAVQRGWQATLDRYLKTYDSPAKMGRLSFRIQQIDFMGDDHAKVLGEWKVTRASDQLAGLFTLILQRLPEGWKIMHDHTSSE